MQLLHAWHHKKKDASNKPWATIVPISLDTLSEHDRARACETVKAYCSSNSLRLVALICMPPASERAADPSLTHMLYSPPITDTNPSSQKFLPLILAKEDVWKDLAAREVLEPVLITRDYIKLLRRWSGRVIVVSGCSQSNVLCKLQIVDYYPKPSDKLSAQPGLDLPLTQCDENCAMFYATTSNPWALEYHLFSVDHWFPIATYQERRLTWT
jgi:hypothetical protein